MNKSEKQGPDHDCTCTVEDSSDGSASMEDDRYCPIHGDLAEIAAERDALVAERDSLRDLTRILRAECEQVKDERDRWRAIPFASRFWAFAEEDPEAFRDCVADFLNKLADKTSGGQRDPVCVEGWPECDDGAYDPRCCRFPKSCSCGSSRGVGIPLHNTQSGEATS